MATKYKLNELAKDLKLQNAQVIECIEKAFGQTKKTVSALNADEINYVLEFFTQQNSVESFSDYFNSANNREQPEPQPEPKAKPSEVKNTETKKPKKDSKPEGEKKAKKPVPKKDETSKKEEPKKEPVKQESQPKKEAVKPPQKKKEPPKKKEKGERLKLNTGRGESSGGYTVSEQGKDSNRRTVDTRGSYVELDKYNEKYDTLADSRQGRGRDNYSKKQKLTQKSQQYKKLAELGK